MNKPNPKPNQPTPNQTKQKQTKKTPTNQPTKPQTNQTKNPDKKGLLSFITIEGEKRGKNILLATAERDPLVAFIDLGLLL